MTLAVVLAEFGRPTPDLEQFRRYFPEASIQYHTDCPDVFEPHRRWPWRMNDYWKVRKALDSGADIAIAFDGDMRIVSERVRSILPLAERFGLCLPANPRLLVKRDTEIGADSDGELDETGGLGFALNCTPIAINLRDERAVRTAETFCEIMRERPVRGPLAWWRACYRTGFSPCLLPFQWCVCQEHIGIGDEIILHVGHEKVARYYAAHRTS